MDNSPQPQASQQNTQAPDAESLQPRTDDTLQQTEVKKASDAPSPNGGRKLRRTTYRPSHRATFIGLAAVILILAINAGILGLVLKKNAAKTNSNLPNGQITLSKSALSKIGVNSAAVGDSGVTLVVGPNAEFKGKVTIAGDTSIGGKLQLTSALVATDANLTQLEAGNASLSQLNVSGNSTLSALSLRNNLAVAGTSQFQGAVTLTQLLTVNNSANVIGNLAVGGVLSVSTFSARNLTSTSSLNVGGHIVTGGLNPSGGSGGAALGSNGTASVSGNDASGTIFLGIGVNATSGTLASVAFRNQYGAIPRITISPVGNISAACTFYVLNPSVGGFSVGDFCVGGNSVNGGLFHGSYALDYIVEQ